MHVVTAFSLADSPEDAVVPELKPRREGKNRWCGGIFKGAVMSWLHQQDPPL